MRRAIDGHLLEWSVDCRFECPFETARRRGTDCLDLLHCLSHPHVTGLIYPDMSRLILPLFCFALMSQCVQAEDVSLLAPPRAMGRNRLAYESWVPLITQVANGGTEDEELLVTSYFDDVRDRQFGRRFWIPENSVRTIWYLIRTPPPPSLAANANGGQQEEVQPKNAQTLLLRERGAVETAVLSDDGKRTTDRFLRCSPVAPDTLMIGDANDDESLHLVNAARIQGSRDPLFHLSDQDPLPPVVEAYSGLRCIVLASDRVLSDQSGLQALRDWMIRGGRLWILADRVGVDVVDQLLDGEAALTEIDRVDLTTVRMERGSRSLGSVRSPVREFETPVEMVRVIADNFDEVFHVDGFPAALERTIGDGRLLVTTLGSRAWYRRPTSAETRILPKKTLVRNVQAYPTSECATLSTVFWGLGEETTTESVDWRAASTGLVGYAVTSRKHVALCLVGFCVVLLVAGSIAWKTGRLASIASVALALSALVTLGLIGLGMTSRSAIPPTQAMVQLADFDVLGNTRIRGAMSIYRTGIGQKIIQAPDQGTIQFTAAPSGSATRLVWTSSGHKQWENVQIPAGVQELEFDVWQTFAPSQAVLTLNSNGLVGHFSGRDWDRPESGILASRGGRLAVVQFTDQGLESNTQDVLPTGRFVAEDVVDDRAQRRIALSKRIFSGNRRLPNQPRLYFWDTPLPLGIDAVDAQRQVGEAIVNLPVVFERPPSGTSVSLPPSVIQYNTVPHPTLGLSSVYNNRTGLWNESQSEENFTTLECHFPTALGPITLERIRFSAELRIPNRDVRLLAVGSDGTETELMSWQSPVGPVRFDIDSQPGWQQDGGPFTLIIHVGTFQGDTDTSPDQTTWRIHDVWLEAWGTTAS